MARIRVASVNVNGIRAAVRKGMLDWLDAADADVVTLQEVRAQDEHLASLLPGWHFVHDECSAKGRAGVAVLTREPVAATRCDFGDEAFDTTGRWLEVDIPTAAGTLTVVSAYAPTGEAETPKQDIKWQYFDVLEPKLAELGRGLALITGDLNVAHQKIDIRNWRGNVKRAGFLPREREYFDRMLAAETGWVDVGRAFHGEVDGPYTWWSNRGQAFTNDTGWRIDYHLASPALAPRASNYLVARYPSYDARWSDHAPVIADYEV